MKTGKLAWAQKFKTFLWAPLLTTGGNLVFGGGTNDRLFRAYDATNGKVVANVPICAGTDSTWYDPGTKLAFSSCRDGKITVAKVDGDKMEPKDVAADFLKSKGVLK